jgi:RNA polymerase sigma-70 factor (ECF subfamily)
LLVKRGETVYHNPSEGQTPNEVILVQRAIGHDAEAFGRLYDMHVDRVYRHIYYRVGNEADAEDLTQQVFLKAWQAIDRYKKTASPFIAWLMTISHNLVIDFYRTKKDKAYLEAEVLADGATSSPEGTVEASFEQQRLRRAILQLSGDEQQVVILRFMEGFEFTEIASLLKKKEGNVRVILHRALVKLRNILEKERKGN